LFLVIGQISSTLNLHITEPRRTSLMCAMWTGHSRLRLPRDGCGFSMIFVMASSSKSAYTSPVSAVQCVEQYYSCAFV
jgi:hypothetical protein